MTTCATEHLPAEWYIKLLSVKTKLSWVFEVSRTTLTTDVHDICFTVHVDWATVAPAVKEMEAEENSRQEGEIEAKRVEVHEVDASLEGENVASALREYAGDCVVCHVGRANNVKYLVR